jgi:predicted nucleic acid-binding protein
MVCLDTNIIIDYIRGKQNIVEFVNKCIREGSIRTTAITQYELGLYGDGKPTPGKELANLMETYPLSNEAADRASELFHILKAKGRLINELDILIAGIALSNDDILVTQDRDFLALESDRILVI